MRQRLVRLVVAVAVPRRAVEAALARRRPSITARWAARWDAGRATVPSDNWGRPLTVRRWARPAWRRGLAKSSGRCRGGRRAVAVGAAVVIEARGHRALADRGRGRRAAEVVVTWVLLLLQRKVRLLRESRLVAEVGARRRSGRRRSRHWRRPAAAVVASVAAAVCVPTVPLIAPISAVVAPVAVPAAVAVVPAEPIVAAAVAPVRRVGPSPAVVAATASSSSSRRSPGASRVVPRPIRGLSDLHLGKV